MSSSIPKIGAHVSASGGLSNSVMNAQKIGADCFQIFGASPRQWFAKKPDKNEIARYQAMLKKSGFGPVFLHAAYLPNLASPNKEILKKSVKNLSDHLEIAEAIKAEGLIFHVGSGKGSSRKEALDQEILGMKEILKSVPGKTKLIMENTAGGGDKIGSIEDIAYLYKKVNSARIKICYDTAHGLESGLIEKYEPAGIKNLFDEWNKAIGIENIIALHVNDSKTAFQSHHDRHENIGEGVIGPNGFRNLAKEKRLVSAAWILEVPGFDDQGPDAKNVSILKSCFK